MVGRKKKKQEEVGGGGSWQTPTHYLRPPLLLLLPLFFPYPLPISQCNQLSSAASYLKLGHTSSSLAPLPHTPPLLHILWNQHLTDLEVLDRTST